MMSENDRRIGGSGEEKYLVKMRLAALGNVANTPSVMVMLLIPDLGNEEELNPEGGELPLFFPVPMPAPLAQSHFRWVQRQKTNAQSEENLEQAFLRGVGAKVHSVNILEHIHGFQVKLNMTLASGETIDVNTRLHLGVLFALQNHLPIYVEEILLLRVGKAVRLNFMDVQGEHQTDIAPAALSFHIKRGDKPSDLDDRITDELLGNLDEEKRAELTELAIEYEVYEWAQLFKDLEEREAQKDKE